ncbi:hypothetical protein, partial [Mycobacterium sp.]|uniref:hypothetical protein n=1 Tax=Mycobacterium sp. TaxID=1785 RepID=UPI002624751A
SVCIPHARIPPGNFVVGLLSLLVIAWLVLGQVRPATPPATPRSRPSLGGIVTARHARLRRARDRHRVGS